ncbi:hypothetical protein BDY21DRAFT_388374 [Lineolata rhizophorae]|uniref:HECT-type E3 ubiquitin transferase n=1 Tax=Lineolata rhizophorae TaxID=578093 RepID=A0A6A6NMC5_9PEZI|nr:hypothetical protein BDY21DRAFT_388374 [Lineolata rhizophorae]
MSSRVTRSTARLTAGSSNNSSANDRQQPPQPQPPPPPPPPPPTSLPSRPAASSRKRKNREPSSEPAPDPPAQNTSPPRRRAKRTRVDQLQQQPQPTNATASSHPADDQAAVGTPAPNGRKRRGKAPAAMSNAGYARDADYPHAGPSSLTSSRRTRRTAPKPDEDVTMRDADDNDGQEEGKDNARPDSPDESEGDTPRYDDDDLANPFDNFLARRGASSELSNTLRALSGMMSGVTSRLRGILENLRNKSDPSIQLIALNELSEILLVSTEDNLAGHFSPDPYVKELITLMQPNDFGDENPEIMLSACRCIANLIEALPASTANIVYAGAVPVLCQKLLEIHYIDLAEQALTTLEKISVEFPASIVREGGLTACLTYLDFFPTGTQRTAVTTAANCCRNIPDDSFPVVRDVMPILLNVLNSSDQKVVEQGCLCVSRIVESFRFKESKLEELVSSDLLKAVLRLLLPGTTNLIGPNIHTQFLRVLAITARASPRLSAELLQMNVVDTLYQILTGVSPPSGSEDIATKIDSVVIMQALIHRPREQIFETLNVICELLPDVSEDGLMFLDDLYDAGYPGDEHVSLSTGSRRSSNEQRIQLLETCKDQVKRFAVILLPTLTDAYSSTVNLSVRQKVLTAQLKMLSNLDTDILEDALRLVPYASYLASILSQQDHPTLVTFALQAAELLLKRLEPIYRYQFYREGVIAEIIKLAQRPCKSLEEKPKQSKAVIEVEPADSVSSDEDREVGECVAEPAIDEVRDGDYPSEDDDDHDEHDGHGDDDSDSSSSEDIYPPGGPLPNVEDIITMRAKKFVEVHETDQGKGLRKKGEEILNDLKELAEGIKACYLRSDTSDGVEHFKRLAEYFDGDALDSITSYELLTSNIVEVLLEVFSEPDKYASTDARSAFLEAFMGANVQVKQKTAASNSPSTPFSILVHKLQDLLSRAEHFAVITVHQNSFDSNRSSAATMLAKQLRLKLVADEGSGIPPGYQNIMVSIHAIATFKALDDYLRPRISLADDPRSSRNRDRVSESTLAAYAAALAGRGGLPDGRGSSFMPPMPLPSDTTNRPSTSRRSNRPKPPAGGSSAQPSSSAPQERPAASRRSTRRTRQQQEAAPAPPPPPPPAPQEATENDQLECADETQLSDEDDMEDDGALDAIVDDLDDEMDEDAPDPSAVNMEVGATGRVTARSEDGTRVATPLGGGGGPSSRASAAHQLLAQELRGSRHGFGAPSRAMSYAAAVNVPQDWHIEFSVNDQPISNDTTIYRAVHFNQTTPNDISSRNVWSAIHTIKFKRASGPPPAESNSLTPPPDAQSATASGIPHSLDKNPTTSAILRLLSILHNLNSNLDDVISDKKDDVKLNAEPLSQFVNTKLTAKLNRQLEEPLIVASNCLPSWAEDLARFYPFLFPFETRHLFLQSTSFGYSRSMTRWQNAQQSSDSRHDRHRDERPFLGRLQRQKVRISRNKILESGIKVMELYGSSPSVLEVEYFEEVGTGLGPTLEFYATVSKEFSKKKLKLWRENESSARDEHAFGTRGLFPAPMSAEQAEAENGKRVLHLFKMLGKFVARSMLDSRIIDIFFNPTFFRIGNTAAAVKPSLGAVRSVDADLAHSLKLLKQFANAKRRIDESTSLTPAQKVQAVQDISFDGSQVEDLGLDFTLPGYPDIELQPGGADTAVTIDNVALYVERVLDFTLGCGVRRQVEAFRQGFSLVFPYSALRAFTPDELVMLFGQAEEDWNLETLMDSIKADHGYNLDSKSVRNLLQTMSELTPPQRRDFLQFVTGSPKLPIGGFKSLTPMFTVVCKPSEPPFTSDDYLPSVMTCVNYLKMPDYSSLKVLREKLFVAIKEGQGAFHLS